MFRLSDRFIQNCTLFPSNNALFINEKYYTYSELLQLTHIVILSLKNENITDEKIAIYCSDDVETYVAILAVTIYGACYLPVNSKNPVHYNAEILLNSDVKTILYAGQKEIPTQLKIHKSIAVNSSYEGVGFRCSETKTCC